MMLKWHNFQVFRCLVIVMSECGHTQNFLWIWNESVKIASSTKFKYDQLFNYSSSFIFPTQKIRWYTGNKRLPWWQTKTMSVVNVCKVTLKSLKLKWENFVSLSCNFLELLGKALREWILPSLGIDRVNMAQFYTWKQILTVPATFFLSLPHQFLSELDTFYRNNPERSWYASFQHWYYQNSIRYFSTKFLMRATNVTMTVFQLFWHCSDVNQLYWHQSDHNVLFWLL